jgi:hypothetical protein
MTEHEIRVQIHAILDSHADALTAIRTAHQRMQDAFLAHDDALVSTIAANRAALILLNRLLQEGINE